MGNSFEQFGQFLIFRAIGRGGMGEVFVARTPWEECPLAAIKRLRPDVARVPNFAERFRREAELAVRLYHSNVVATLDVGSVNEQLYVACELVPGKDTGFIGDRLRERGQGAPLAVVIRVLLDTLAGLAYVHSARERNGDWMRLVHRDITPGNVLVGYDGIARLADFGLAKSEISKESALTQYGEILGTPHYLAPEVIRGEPASPASDIYGLGAVMYRVLTGVAPYQGTAAEVLVKALKNKPKPLGDLRPDLPPWFVTAIHSMLDGDRIERPSDAGLLMRRIEHAAGRFKLLLPQASVGRWLSALFEEEKKDEISEFDAIESMDVKNVERKVEGTMVLAQARTESRLEGDDPFGNDSIDEATLLAEPNLDEELELADETFEGVELVGLENVAAAHKQTMRTQLIPENTSEKEPRFESEDETGDYAEREEVRQSFELPGFVDENSEKSLEARLITSPHQSLQIKNTKNTIEGRSEIVSSDFEEGDFDTAGAEPNIRSASDLQPVSISASKGSSPSSIDPRKVTKSRSSSPTRKELSGDTWSGSYWITLVVGLAFAALIGATVAIWSTRKPNVQPKEIQPLPGASELVLLQKRYRSVRSKMSELSRRGVVITPEINTGAAKAADLLLLGQTEAATKQLSEIEAFLAEYETE